MRLTPELVQQIFAERPHVRRAHAALVPQSVDEKAFWSQFMKHEMARRVWTLVPKSAFSVAVPRHMPRAESMVRR